MAKVQASYMKCVYRLNLFTLQCKNINITGKSLLLTGAKTNIFIFSDVEMYREPGHMHFNNSSWSANAKKYFFVGQAVDYALF